MKKNLDFFKVAILVFMAGLLVLIYRFSENGRYQNVGSYIDYVIDTRTGQVYEVDVVKDGQ